MPEGLPQEAVDLLKWAYLGEVGGEAWFAAQIDRAPEAREQLTRLAELERATGEDIARILAAHDIEIEAEAVESARTGAARLLAEGKDWAWFRREAGQAAIDQAVAGYRRLGELAEACRPLAERLVAHEDIIRQEMAA